MWTDHSFEIQSDYDGTIHICRFCCKHYEEPSEYGIENGRVSKLSIFIDGVMTLDYDRGWVMESNDDITNKALSMILAEYN